MTDRDEESVRGYSVETHKSMRCGQRCGQLSENITSLTSSDMCPLTHTRSHLNVQLKLHSVTLHQTLSFVTPVLSLTHTNYRQSEKESVRLRVCLIVARFQSISSASARDLRLCCLEAVETLCLNSSSV